MLVVPFVRILASYIDCSSVSLTPVTCIDSSYRFVAPLLVLLLLAYLWVLVPFSLVQGDVRYVQSREIFSPATWFGNSNLKNARLNVGYLTVTHKHAFRRGLALLALKV